MLTLAEYKARVISALKDYPSGKNIFSLYGETPQFNSLIENDYQKAINGDIDISRTVVRIYGRY